MDALSELAGEPQRAAIFLDVDGTLARRSSPTRPTRRVPDATRAVLEGLAGRYALVACVSGRTGERAREIVGVPGITYVGEHGLELDPEAEAWAPRIHAFADAAGWPVESKPLSAAFHYRTAATTTLRGARWQASRRPRGQRASARAGAGSCWRCCRRWRRRRAPPVRRLLESSGLRRALYAGDDTTDLDGFAALDDLEVAVRVAVVSAEGPGELGPRADIVVRSPQELTVLLARL